MSDFDDRNDLYEDYPPRPARRQWDNVPMGSIFSPEMLKEIHDMNLKIAKACLHIEQLTKEKDQLSEVTKNLEDRITKLNDQLISLSVKLDGASYNAGESKRDIKIAIGSVLLAILAVAVERIFSQ